MIYFSDDKIIIRDLLEDDISNLFSWRIDKEINKHELRPLPQNSSELLEICKDFCFDFENEVSPRTQGDRKYFYFMITNLQGLPVGCVNYFSIDKAKKHCELGVTIGERSYRRKGIAFLVVKFVVNYIFENMDIDRILIETSVLNKPALKLFDKLGFVKCGEYLEEDESRIIVLEIIR